MIRLPRIFLWWLLLCAAAASLPGCTPQQVRTVGAVAGAVEQTATLTGHAPCAAVAAGVAALCNIYGGL